jgi:hypothetical protein
MSFFREHKVINLITKALLFISPYLLVFICPVFAQDGDSIYFSNVSLSPGCSGEVSIYLHNSSFPVGGFTLRLALEDSLNVSITGVERGSSVANFDCFTSRFGQGFCKVTAIADWPGGNNPPPLALGYSEIARISLAAATDIPNGLLDSLFFRDDTLPPYRDNSISDNTGYLLVIPKLRGAVVAIHPTQGADDKVINLPEDAILLPNYPNPFNAETNLSFELPALSRDIRLSIFDTLGRRLKSFSWESLGIGKYSVIWDGRDEAGNGVSSGVYFCCLNVLNNRAQNMKITLLR